MVNRKNGWFATNLFYLIFVGNYRRYTVFAGNSRVRNIILLIVVGCQFIYIIVQFFRMILKTRLVHPETHRSHCFSPIGAHERK